MDTFVTETDDGFVWKNNRKVLLITWLVMAVLALAGFAAGWIAVIFFEVIIAFTVLFCGLLLKNRKGFALTFEGNDLYITDRYRGREYCVYNIPASDFVFRQTEKEKEQCLCTVKIRDTMFSFSGVKQSERLQAYVAEHYT